MALVPTMGALHAGHLHLVRSALNAGHAVAVSIFVNPLQFNDPKDLAAYPRTLESDMALLREVGCHMVFTPNAESLYTGFNIRHYQLGGLDSVFEAASRPGHFQGVVNVVERLFHYVRPDVAYFGEKDRQQLAVVQHVARTMLWPERIVGVPTVRADDGLALSSRNVRLSINERAQALVLYRALRKAAEQAFRSTPAETVQAAADIMATEPAVALDYFALADPATLEPITDWEDRTEVVALVAAQVGPVRLIDNYTLSR